MSRCAHRHVTQLVPGIHWCVGCGAYRTVLMELEFRDGRPTGGWLPVWSKWNKPAQRKKSK